MIIYGKQLFLHILDAHKQNLKEIYLAKEIDKSLFAKISRLSVKILKIDNKKAQALAHGGNHQGFLAKVDEFEFCEIADLKEAKFLVILWNLSDIGNIGAIVRSAYALGADAICVVSKNLQIEGVIRASSGAAYEIKIARIDDGAGLINELKQIGFQIFAATMDGEDIKTAKIGAKTALILGSEGEGIPQKIVTKCDHSVSIKMKHGWDSLNVSAAFAIICDRMING